MPVCQTFDDVVFFFCTAASASNDSKAHSGHVHTRLLTPKLIRGADVPCKIAACLPSHLRSSLLASRCGQRIPRKRPIPLQAVSAEQYPVPWHLHKEAQEQFSKAAADEREQAQNKSLAQEREIGQLLAQKSQLLNDVVSARGEIDVRGAIEVVARVEENRMPPSKQRRGVQQILRWMVQNNITLQTRIKKVCQARKLDESRIRQILQRSLYDTASKYLRGTSHTHLTVHVGHPWVVNDAAAICILLDAMNLTYKYRNRAGKIVLSPYA